MRSSLLILSSLVVLLPGATFGEELPPAEVTRLSGTVKDILRTRCAECHGGTSTQADIDVLQWKQLIEQKTVLPGKPDESPLFQAITNANENVRMPQDLPALPAEDIQQIRQWIAAGAPAFPSDVAQPRELQKENEFQSVVGIDYVLKQIHQHQRTLKLEEKRYIRYFSANHLLAAGVTRDTLDLQRQALAKTINHLSRETELAQPVPINGETGTVFAVDIRKLGWHKAALKPVEKVGTGISSLNLYDLILLEYPYAIAYEDSATYDALALEYLGPAGMVRPVPFIRVDWFCSVATLPPLYHDLLQLPRNLAALEKELEVDADANLAHHRAQRAAMAVSGVSRNNRAVERHPYRHGAYWKSIDYATSKGTENIFTDPINLHGTGGEMIFNLPNGLQAYYVADAKGNRLNEAPTSIVTDRFAEDKTVRNGLSCIRCHDRGMKEFRDDVRPAVERLTGSGHIKKGEVLSLYPPRDDMSALVKQDRERFLVALEKAFGKPQTTEPLAPVSQLFLDAPLQLGTVAGELGLIDASELKTIFRQPNFTGLGLVALGSAGVVRRDMWEDYYDEVVRSLGLGIPLIPIDGLTRPDYKPQGTHLSVALATNKKNNVFAPGDVLSVLVTNQGKAAVFIELSGSGTEGEKVILVPSSTKVEPGQTFRFPEKGALTVQPSLGKELITLLASESEFAPGRVFRGTNTDDRIVHDFYASEVSTARPNLTRDARSMLKHTIEIETR